MGERNYPSYLRLIKPSEKSIQKDRGINSNPRDLEPLISIGESIISRYKDIVDSEDVFVKPDRFEDITKFYNRVIILNRKLTTFNNTRLDALAIYGMNASEMYISDYIKPFQFRILMDGLIELSAMSIHRVGKFSVSDFIDTMGGKNPDKATIAHFEGLRLTSFSHGDGLRLVK